MKWEYKVVVWDLNTFQDYMNKLGLEGWELVTTDENYLYFKRPLELNKNI